MNLNEINSDMRHAVNEELKNKVLSNPLNQEHILGDSSSVLSLKWFDEIGKLVNNITTSTEFKEKVKNAYQLNQLVINHKSELKEGQVKYATKFINTYKSHFKEFENEIKTDSTIDRFVELHDQISLEIGRGNIQQSFNLSEEYLKLKDEIKALGRVKDGLSLNQFKKVQTIITDDNSTYLNVKAMIKAKDTGSVNDFSEFTAEMLLELRENFDEIERNMVQQAFADYKENIKSLERILETEGKDDEFDENMIIKSFKHLTVKSYCAACPYNGKATCPQNPSKCISSKANNEIVSFWSVMSNPVGNIVRLHNSKVKANRASLSALKEEGGVVVQPTSETQPEGQEMALNEKSDNLTGNWGKPGSMFDVYKSPEKIETKPSIVEEEKEYDVPF